MRQVLKYAAVAVVSVLVTVAALYVWFAWQMFHVFNN
jgi:hypothetical protein